MNRRAAELKNLKWGMFICWSFSTFSGKEWTPGVKDVSFFKATEVDTDQWAKTAKEAGMGYILFLTKHHDGFCLWDTKTTDRKVTKAPLGKDVLRLLKKSCDKYGIKLALYFSEGEFNDNKNYHPGGYTPEMKKAQLKELLTQYGPVEYIWFDTAQGEGGLSHGETLAWCKSFQPGCFIGFNHGDQEGCDVRIGEMGRPGPLSDAKAAGISSGKPAKSYLLAEFTYPILPGHKGGAQWFYSLPVHDGLCRSAESLYADYLGAVKFGNIFSIDVGPDFKGRLRDIDVKTLQKVGEMIRNGSQASTQKDPIRAFCVDFNWGPGGPNGFAKPGLWADADPAKHVAWYKALGANVIQTFAVSCNGYAWYKGGKIPEQPGMVHDFLPEVVKLGHKNGMKVMGYFCIAANTRWGNEHPDLSYGTPSTYHLPFTDEYLDYLGMAIEEALTKSGMDGFMADWVWNPTDQARKGKWLPAEKKLFKKLTGKPFPGEDKLTGDMMSDYQRKAIDRCWERIRSTAKRVKPDCVIWLTCNNIKDPVIAGSRMLKEMDWVMDESGNPEAMRGVAPMFGPKTRQLLCVVGWGDGHDARKILADTGIASFGIYGFAKPNPDSLPLPIETYLNQAIESFKGNDRNIAVLARIFNGKQLPKSPDVSVKASTADKPRDLKFKWFDEAKYGLFINWGLYSIPAGEWKGKKMDGIGEWIMLWAKIPVKEYEQLAKQFNPQKFNAEEWAQLAEDAGMKYLVFDCKHHDGFALYRSAVTNYNCFDATPWKRDPFKELEQACKKHNIKLCFYYSQATDWHEPNGGMNNWDFKPDNEKDFDQYLRDKSMPQVTELLKNYGPIGLIWFDVPVLMTPERSKKLADLVRSIQPDVLINSRLGKGDFHDYRSMGDNEIPHTTVEGAWETAATVNDTWGYKKEDHNWKQPDDITFKLVDIVSKGGNYLLNVGPDADGFIPQPSQDILRRVGKWLKVNGESIYDAGRTPFGDEFGKYDPEKKDKKGRPVFNESKDWRCTTKPGKLYIHLFKWPGAKFELAGFNGKVEKAYMLADPDRKPLKCGVTDGKLTVELQEKATDQIDSVLCLEVK